MRIERALIVGGGIAGLAAARGLTRAGVETVIVENVEAWRPVGAGIVLNVNAMAALRRLGLADAVESRGFRLGEGAITDQTGRALARTDFGALDADFGPTIGLHRAELHAALLEGACDAAIHLGTSVAQIAQHSDCVDVELTNGRAERFDLVIGADGLHSRVRELSFGHVPTVYAGYTCWRFVVDVQLERSGLCEMWGRGLRFGCVPIGEHTSYIFAVANAAPDTPDPEAGRLQRLRKRFSSFGGPAPALLDALEAPDELIHNDLRAVPVGNWFDGRVVLIGDAAHAMTPNMGQGAGMGLEDAAVLVELVQAGGEISEVLAEYRARRESRVRWVQNQSRRIGRIGQLENPLACRLRNAAVKLIPDSTSTRALRKLVSQPI